MTSPRARMACPLTCLLGWAGAALLALGSGGLTGLGAPSTRDAANEGLASGAQASGAPIFPDAVVGGDNVGFTSVAGDFNGDGRPDLLEDARRCLDGSCYRAFAVHLGRGDGTFSLPDLPPIRSFPGELISISLTDDYRCLVSLDSLTEILAAADFDGDGADDLVALAVDRALVLLSRRDGCFEAARSFEVGPGARGVAVADFSGDGAFDLAVAFSASGAEPRPRLASEDSGGVTVLVGDGGGGFGERVDLPLAGRPYTIAAADLNSDQRPDLALVDVDSGEVAILHGTGGSAFSAAPRIFLGRDPRSILAGDFNSDGRGDLAVRHASNETLYLLLSQADGSFAARALSVATGQAAEPPPAEPGDPQPIYLVPMVDLTPLAAADLNRDGRLDLAVPGGANGIAVLLGRGDGTFDPARGAANLTYSRVVSLRDFDRDGAPDLAAASSANPVLLRGRGDGSFGGGLRLPVGSSPVALAAADFDRDGRPDLAVANEFSNDVSILLSGGRGFAPQRRVEVGLGPASIASADLNGDGMADLVVSNSTSGDVSILLGLGDGSFVPQARLPVGGGAGPLRVADADGDGRSDILVVSDTPGTECPPAERLTFLPGRGDGSFGEASHLPLRGARHVLAEGDFNRDGRADLAALGGGNLLCGSIGPRGAFDPSPPPPATSTTLLDVLIGAGAGTLEPVQSLDLPYWVGSIAAADWTSDGILDLIEMRGTQTRVALLRAGLGDGTFSLSPEHFAIYPAPGTIDSGFGMSLRHLDLVSAADFDANGLRDAAFLHQPGSDVAVLGGDGAGLPRFLGRYLTGSRPVAAAAADFDGDRRIDLAVAEEFGSEVTVLYNQGPFPVRPVGIDVKPGDAANVVRPGAEGAVPVAILGEAGFDPASVDPGSIRLAGAGVKGAGGLEARPLCRSADVNADGFSDLLCQILGGEMTLDPAHPVAVLEACTFEGVPIRGEDAVRLVGSRSPTDAGRVR